MIANREAMLDLVAAYAVDAVDVAERLQVETALAADAALRRELDDHRAVLATLAQAVESHPATPSPLVWERIAAGIEGTDEVSPRLASVHDLRSQRRFSRLTASLAVAAIALGALLAVSVAQLQPDGGTAPVELAIAEMLADPEATVATLAAPDAGGTEARIVIDAAGLGYVYADTLPALDSTRTYQLWAILGERVISAGVLGNDPDDSPFQVAGEVTGFAITEEIAGGVAVSEQEPVVLWIRNA